MVFDPFPPYCILIIIISKDTRDRIQLCLTVFDADLAVAPMIKMPYPNCATDAFVVEAVFAIWSTIVSASALSMTEKLWMHLSPLQGWIMPLWYLHSARQGCT